MKYATVSDSSAEKNWPVKERLSICAPLHHLKSLLHSELSIPDKSVQRGWV